MDLAHPFCAMWWVLAWMVFAHGASSSRLRGGTDCSAHAYASCATRQKSNTTYFHSVCHLKPWHARAALAATFLLSDAVGPPAFALDLGAGCMDLGAVLPQGVIYVPVDEVATTGLTYPPSTYEQRHRVCDFNVGMFPVVPTPLQGARGSVAALGVVEYMCDVGSFLGALRSYNLPGVVSYAHVNAPNTSSLTAHFRENWLTDSQFLTLLHTSGLHVIAMAHIMVGGLDNIVYKFNPVPLR